MTFNPGCWSRDLQVSFSNLCLHAGLPGEKGPLPWGVPLAFYSTPHSTTTIHPATALTHALLSEIGTPSD